MNALKIAALSAALTMATGAHASSLDGEQKLIEQRWYSFEEIEQKRQQYGRIPISRGYIVHFFDGEDAGKIDAPQEKATDLQLFYSTHGAVSTYDKEDYSTALDKVCIDTVSQSLATFVGLHTVKDHPDRLSHKRYVTGIRSLTYLGPEHNFKGIKSWAEVERPENKRSLLCEIYEVAGEANDEKYVVYAGARADAFYDEIHNAPHYEPDDD